MSQEIYSLVLAALKLSHQSRTFLNVAYQPCLAYCLAHRSASHWENSRHSRWRNLSIKASYAAHSNSNACHISSALIFRNGGKLDLCLLQHSEGHVCGCNQLKQTFVGFAVPSLSGFLSKWTVSLSALTSVHQHFLLPPFFFLTNKKKNSEYNNSRVNKVTNVGRKS